MVTRILVEKTSGFDIEAKSLRDELVKTLHLENLEGVRIVNCYDMEGVETAALETIKASVLSEPNVDRVYEGHFEANADEMAFRIALLPGQYDQRADSAAQCIEIVTLKTRPVIASSRIIALKGQLKTAEVEAIKKFLINPVEAHEVSISIPETLIMTGESPEAVATIEGFMDWSSDALLGFRTQMGFAMSEADIKHVQNYFRDEEQRDPTITELKVIDTYWSDHCRHTTFMTVLESVGIEAGEYSAPIYKAFENYTQLREMVYEKGTRPMSLMDLATINMKAMRKQGALEDLDVSEEINACSIKIDVDVNGVTEPWLLMFKNETHNHPTEIEPFGGAATCLGGAIRDPLSGRSYVYQSMRVSGSGNPLSPVEETLEGKLPQKTITQKAAAGFSAYGNQIGLATGHVAEVYDDGFVAKRMEVGAVIGAAPVKQVVRSVPAAGDLVVLIGGRTGRDGVGGATGSSKAHTEDSLLSCGAEVQKGNAPEERKIQRLFRNPELTTKIKRCNDFGAGGVSVAIGELADSLEINLDAVPKKYEGLDGTELAISESQERMAVVIAPEHLEEVLHQCAMENLEATVVAVVKDHGRLAMKWKGRDVLNLSRAFLDTNGVRGKANVLVTTPDQVSYFSRRKLLCDASESGLIRLLSDLNVCSQKGLVERFDNTIGAGTVLMPFGGKTALTPSQTMVAKIPVLGAETETVSLMSYGYDPGIGKWSPFHGGVYAVVDAMAKLVAVGGDYKKARLSLQEYFERLGDHPSKWGKPLAALLGASFAQSAFGTAAIGGKDSMSGTFKDLDVPPTLIAFAVSHGHAKHIKPQVFTTPGSKIALVKAKRDAYEMVDFEALQKQYDAVLSGMAKGEVISAYAIGQGGVAAAVAKMAFGNRIGFKLESGVDLFDFAYGSLIMEVSPDYRPSVDGVEMIGTLTADYTLDYGKFSVSGPVAEQAWQAPLAPIFPAVHTDEVSETAKTFSFEKKLYVPKPTFKTAKPKVFIPVFPGSNCEYDTERAFRNAGAEVETTVFRNLTAKDVEASIEAFARAIKSSQIIAIPGGFSAGDEPEGSGKFIASVFRNPVLAEAIMEHLEKRDGLMLGICNGFQALVKLGLLPYGDIRKLDESSPTLTFNKIGRHVARMAHVRVSSVNSPWLDGFKVGDVFETAFSHGEGRFYASDAFVEEMAAKGQIATQYVDASGAATTDPQYNINGSVHAIEGVFSPDGRVFGKMGHAERYGDHLYKNIPGNTHFDLFKAGVNYFK